MDKRTQKKYDIINKSFGVMLEQGYHGTSIKDLTDAVGIPKGSLYNYFENKEDYVREALIYYYEVLSKPLFGILSDENLQALDRIKEFYMGAINEMQENNTVLNGCFIGKIIQEISGTNDNIQPLLDKISKDIIGKLRDNIKEAQEMEKISKTVEAEVLAEVINASWQGSLLGIKASRDSETLSRFYRTPKRRLLALNTSQFSYLCVASEMNFCKYLHKDT